MLTRVLKRSRILFSQLWVYGGSLLCFCTFFGARAPALTRLLHTFSRREREDHATSDYYWLGRQTPSCHPAWAFQGSEHAIIRLLGDCGRIRTSLRCTIAAKPIHSHGLLVPLTLLNTVEMRPFGNSVFLSLSPRCTLTRERVALHSCIFYSFPSPRSQENL